MNKLIGCPVIFVPCCKYKKYFRNPEDDMQPVRGVIEYINERHGWFMVKYTAGRTVQHECFKLVDIGKVVELVGRR